MTPLHRRPVTFLHSDARLARRILRPINRFMQVEAAGGIVLLVMTVVALLWANSPASASYRDLFHARIALEVGQRRVAEDLTHWINDALMAVFFFVVGLEIKREWVTGELQDRRAALLPAVAAAGGMVVPAVLYLAVTTGSRGAHGWGVPMATDIAFALGVLALLGPRVPPTLKVFLLTLAIVDDIGAIVVIAAFYSDSISVSWLVGAGAVVATVALMRRLRMVHPVLYVGAGLALWLFVYESGIHATIAGVAMGLLTPARPLQPVAETERLVDTLENRSELTAEEVHDVSVRVRTSVPETDRLIALLHPWTSFVIIPLFALANAGVELRADSLSSATPVLPAVVVGLVLGKVVGVAGSTWLCIRLGFAELPSGTRWAHILGIAALAGIGFTVSLFVAGLAFTGELQEDAKVGILLASVTAAVLGSVILILTGRRGSETLVPGAPAAGG